MTLIHMLRPEPEPAAATCASASPTASTCAASARRGKLLCVGVDLPIEAGTCGRLVHASSQRCIHCIRRRWWLIKHAFNDADVSIAAMLEGHAAQRPSDDDAPGAVPVLDDLSDLGDPCLRW